ncbi:MAG TPA: AAA family ATPase, partial [Chthonomonadaceae bacterium]|nr:AAA family ATPase [Chthonomonadaceae bacterium]
ADPKITLTSKRPVQNQEIRSLLLRVGFPTTNPNSANIEITGIQNVRRFITQIGSQHPFRKERMDAWMQKPLPVEQKDRTDMIPIGNRLRRVRQALGMGSQHFRSTYSSLFHRYEHKIGHPNRERMRAILEEMFAWAQAKGQDTTELAQIQSLLDGPIGWSKVFSVKAEEKPDYVYDLSCSKPNNFVVNNMLTHNCILWLDELEKGFSGTQSSGMSDGGTTSRVFGTFLTWMQDKKAPAFVVATSNDVTALPPELLRKGRFDEIFFIDLPSPDERKDIFLIHLKKRKRNPEEFDLGRLAEATPGFSGAEIEACVVDALYDAFDENKTLTTESIVAAAHHTVPLSMTMRERIEDLREWANTRARLASSAHTEDMATITQQLMLAKATDPVTNEIHPEALDIRNVIPAPPPSPLDEGSSPL